MASMMLGAIATDLASAMILKVGNRLIESAIGPAQKRKLKELLGSSIQVMLEELARSGELADDPDYVSSLRAQLTNFFSAQEVADAFFSVAIDAEPLPVARLREIYEGHGYDADAFPITFERAMNVGAMRLASYVKDEASNDGSPLNNLVEVSKLYSIEESTRKLLSRTEPIGASADELERESWARCKRRWAVLGVPPDQAAALARNPKVGAPHTEVRDLLRRRVAVITAEVGSGKSLLLDRLMQRAIVRYREHEDTPLPVFLEAREVQGRLRETIVEHTSSLGKPDERGAMVFIDGFDEVDREKARHLLDKAHYLPEMWPNTTVVLAGRPIQELEEEKERNEAFELPKLTEAETEALIRRFSGDERMLGALSYGWPSSIAEAVRRPLFATLVGLDMRNRYGTQARSIGELLSHLVERALRTADEAIELRELRDLAVMVTDSGKGQVRSADTGTGTQVGRLRKTGLVHEEGEVLQFSLQILSEWFAARALEEDEVDIGELASDSARLERWRYPLVMAVSNFGYERTLSIFEPIVTAAPALASQIVDAAFGRHGVAADEPVEGVQDVAKRFRRTMGAWVEGLGPLAPLFAPVRQDGSVGTLAIAGWEPWELGKGNYAWYAGLVKLPDVVPFSRVADSELRYGIPQRTYVVGRQAAWPWHTTFKNLRDELEKTLKTYVPPTLTPVLAREAAWRTAKDLLYQERGRLRSSDRSVALDEIEGLLNEFGAWDGEWIWRRPARTSLRPVLYGARHLVEEVQRLRASGETEMVSPVPAPDLTVEEVKERVGEKGAMYTWDLYSDERLLELSRLLTDEALRAYASIVETLLPKLKPHMPIAATLPGKMVGYLDLRREVNSVGPAVSWYMEPLPGDCENTSEVSLDGRPDYAEQYDEHPSHLRLRILSLRPQIADHITPVTGHLLSGQLFDLTPVTKTCRYWLWEDLKYAKWTNSMNPWSR